jgi:hypothetical protein
VECISIEKQKVVWILKCKEQHKEAARNAQGWLGAHPWAQGGGYKCFFFF